MDAIKIYFEIGFSHIVNWTALDHILFIIALSLRYQFSDWKKLLVLITAFTIGHTTTLTLVVFNVLHLSKAWIEFLIPVTIAITAVSNFFVKKFSFKSKFPLIYFFALIFGFIHGLGFSNDLKSLIGNGNGVVIKLLAANIGIECGQIFFVFCILIITAIATQLFKINRREYLLFLSSGIFALAIEMAVERIPWGHI
ncbi:MAG TPA: HupE/UreJ family protein [Chitinophagaceae bacterium]|nr:HupE/UreJ family protein [Chitinophagaceae bacterium]